MRRVSRLPKADILNQPLCASVVKGLDFQRKKSAGPRRREKIKSPSRGKSAGTTDKSKDNRPIGSITNGLESYGSRSSFYFHINDDKSNHHSGVKIQNNKVNNKKKKKAIVVDPDGTSVEGEHVDSVDDDLSPFGQMNGKTPRHSIFAQPGHDETASGPQKFRMSKVYVKQANINGGQAHSVHKTGYSKMKEQYNKKNKMKKNKKVTKKSKIEKNKFQGRAGSMDDIIQENIIMLADKELYHDRSNQKRLSGVPSQFVNQLKPHEVQGVYGEVLNNKLSEEYQMNFSMTPTKNSKSRPQTGNFKIETPKKSKTALRDQEKSAKKYMIDKTYPLNIDQQPEFRSSTQFKIKNDLAFSQTKYGNLAFEDSGRKRYDITTPKSISKVVPQKDMLISSPKKRSSSTDFQNLKQISKIKELKITRPKSSHRRHSQNEFINRTPLKSERIHTNFSILKVRQEQQKSIAQEEKNNSAKQKNRFSYSKINEQQYKKIVKGIKDRVNGNKSPIEEEKYKNRLVVPRLSVSSILIETKQFELAMETEFKQSPVKTIRDNQTNSLDNFDRYKKIWSHQKQSLSARTKTTNTLIQKSESKNEIRQTVDYTNAIDKSLNQDSINNNLWAKTLRNNDQSIIAKSSNTNSLSNSFFIPTKKAEDFELIRTPNSQNLIKSSKLKSNFNKYASKYLKQQHKNGLDSQKQVINTFQQCQNSDFGEIQIQGTNKLNLEINAADKFKVKYSVQQQRGSVLDQLGDDINRQYKRQSLLNTFQKFDLLNQK